MCGVKTRKTFSRREDEAADAVSAPVRFLEVALAPSPVETAMEGYEIAWPSGVRLRVPRGFCPEEMAMLLELLREGADE